jgi:hypothetical protein
MPPARRNAPSKPGAAAIAPAPLVNAALLAGAIGYGLWILVDRGRLSWPPTDLLAGASTVAGCLALVGPVVLARRDSGESGLGELVWMTGGLLLWVFDLAALARGEARALAWVNPLGVRTMGLTILAVGAAGWRIQGPGRGWRWTNVVGWLLGAFWVGMSLASLWPTRAPGVVAR